MNQTLLLSKLREAHSLIAQFEGDHSGEFLDAKEFAIAIEEAIHELENGNHKIAKELWSWFAPTSTWDDFTHFAGNKA